MELLAWPNAPDLLALKAAIPGHYPALFKTGGANGWDILFAFPQQTKTLHSNARDTEVSAFFSLLPRLAKQDALSSLPFTGGWLLALSYELGGLLDPGLNKTMAGQTGDAESFPLAFAMRIPAAILLDRQAGKTWLMAEDGNTHLIRQMQEDLRTAPHVPMDDLPAYTLTEDDPAQFLRGVDRIKSYIREGDVFQVNLSRAWRADFTANVSPAGLFKRLDLNNPAPFSALLEMGAWTIVSSSPERLARVEENGRVVTRPIAGTHPRSTTPADDEALRQRLAAHPKERAEHIMLVDLERNDLGRVCEPGSVRVEALMELASYAHVHHLESSVAGQLRTGTTLFDLIQAIFPGGTITGCPKIRTMQIIRELEDAPRRAYTGSLGYVNLDGRLDLNILIRSFLLKNNTAWFRTGAGIVADSDPERELEETRAKAKGLLNALMSVKGEGLILVDGLAADGIQAMDRGLHYGDGVFRTMKIVAGEIRWWADHYQKLSSDCASLGLACPDNALLRQEVLQVAAQPGVGVVKIIITRGDGKRGYGIPDEAQPLRMVMGFPAMAHRSRDVQVRWCDLRLSSQPRLAGIKHLNRLENVLARSEWTGADITEGLLMDEAGRVVCGTMSNLFLLENNRLVTPKLDRCGIAGVARERLLRAASRHHMVVCIEEISRQRLLAAEEIFLTNSLIEVWRVASLDHQRWHDTGLAAKLVNWLNEKD